MNSNFLLQHVKAHPCAEPIDTIKFLYHNAFGCGHLLPDEPACVRSIQAEIDQTAVQSDEPPIEALGDGLCRIHLRNPQVRALSPQCIAAMMRVTEAQFSPSRQRFLQNLSQLQALCKQYGSDTVPSSALFRLPYSSQELSDAIQPFLQPDAPLPRHSERYHSAYQPAYRVVLRRFADALPLLYAIEQQLKAKGSATVVLDGYCASGKSTLIALLSQLYDSAVFHMDDFFLPASLRTPQRLAKAGGNVHYERFADEVLIGLLHGGPFTYGQYDCKTGRVHQIATAPASVVFIEGSYALHPAFQAAYQKLDAIRAFMTVSPEAQEQRILARNGETMLKRFQNEWIPLEIQYFKAYHKALEGLIVLSSEQHPEDETEDMRL